jgi:hypothetical protein
MADCPRYVSTIRRTEKIGDSLIKLNNNFFNLRTALCDMHKRLDSLVEVRTFFFYGPNSEEVPTSGMQDQVSSRPSNTTIENFVNGPEPSNLNLPAYSKRNDIAYVIYQKTGFLAKEAVRVKTGSITVVAPGSREGSKVVGWETTAPDRYNVYSPVFIIWKLVYNGSQYKTEIGFPKFTQAETISTPNWNQPQNWTQY